MLNLAFISGFNPTVETRFIASNSTRRSENRRDKSGLYEHYYFHLIKFKDKYRIPSARLKNWDYGANAIYFVTICTQRHGCFFGEILDDEMQLSQIGKTAYALWTEIPKQFPFVILDEFVVMPNHVHGLIVIDKSEDKSDINQDAMNQDAMNQDAMNQDAMNRVSTGGGGITGRSNPMLHQNLSTIIRWYKGRVTHSVREKHRDFMWQTRFHDHIVRNQNSLDKIRNYILNNPITWQHDKFFSDHS